MADGWITADTLVHEKALARVLDGLETGSHIQTWGGTHFMRDDLFELWRGGFL